MGRRVRLLDLWVVGCASFFFLVRELVVYRTRCRHSVHTLCEEEVQAGKERRLEKEKKKEEQ